MAFGWHRLGGWVGRAPSSVGLAVLQGRRAGGGEVSAPSHSMLRSRYQLHSQEEAKERRHSHTIGGLPEADDQPELPSPPALPMALVGKGPLTSIGQCPPPPCASLGPSVPRCPGSLLGHPPIPEPRVNVLLFFWHTQLSSHSFCHTEVLGCGWGPTALLQGIRLILGALHAPLGVQSGALLCSHWDLCVPGGSGGLRQRDWGWQQVMGCITLHPEVTASCTVAPAVPSLVDFSAPCSPGGIALGTAYQSSLRKPAF